MRYIEEKYQQLIKDMERAYDNVHDTLKYHINVLEKIIAEKDEEIEKLRGGDQLQKEIGEYNRLEAQKNMNLEDEITQLKAENSRLKKAYSDLEKAYKLTIDTPAPGKKTSRKTSSKRRKTVSRPTIVAHCKDCGTYFQAKSKLAKYCSKCKERHIKESQTKWRAKQK